MWRNYREIQEKSLHLSVHTHTHMHYVFTFVAVHPDECTMVDTRERVEPNTLAQIHSRGQFHLQQCMHTRELTHSCSFKATQHKGKTLQKRSPELHAIPKSCTCVYHSYASLVLRIRCTTTFNIGVYHNSGCPLSAYALK